MLFFNCEYSPYLYITTTSFHSYTLDFSWQSATRVGNNTFLPLSLMSLASPKKRGRANRKNTASLLDTQPTVDQQDLSVGDSQDPTDPFSRLFRPAQLTVPQLRSLLLQHDVSLPSSARKPALIQAYEEHIRSNVNELRAARNRDLNVRPDGNGIIHLGLGQPPQRTELSDEPLVSDGPDMSGEESDRIRVSYVNEICQQLISLPATLSTVPRIYPTLSAIGVLGRFRGQRKGR